MTELAALLGGFYNRVNLMLELLINCLVFLIPLAKRRNFPFRVISGFVVCVLLRLLMPKFGFSLVLTALCAAAFVYWCCAVSIQDALYCAVCAYATQHFRFSAYDTLRYAAGLPHQVDPTAPTAVSLLLHVTVLVVFYFFFMRNVVDHGHYNVDTRQSLSALVIVLAVVLVLSSAAQAAYREESRTMYIICHLYAMFCCVYILWGEVTKLKRSRLEKEFILQQQLQHQQRQQYALTRENIDIINQKCHDLKHQMAALRTIVPEAQRERYLAEIERSIQIYDSALETGNEVLDTVLTEKSLYCEAHQVAMTCMADGRALGFMDSMDLYAIFGNALDNAIESVIHLPEADKRVVSVSVREKNGLLLFQFENYYEGELHFEEGLPVTTKGESGYHGFGIRSIRDTARKYGGQMTLHTEGNLFILRVSVPIP